MRYVPHTPEDIEAMLSTVGAEDIASLFSPIPDELKLGRALDLPEPLPECKLKGHLEEVARGNTDAGQVASFVGGGLYNHYVPAAVGQMLLRSEFYTAYTPYQPEVSQGTLQAVFEYQTLVARLLNMEVSNASLYDGSTAVAEATGMALRISRHKRSRVLFAGPIHPEYVEVTKTYLTDPEKTLGFVPTGKDGLLDEAALAEQMSADVAAVVVQYPNFFGLLENLARARELTAAHGALLVVAFSEPLAFGLIRPPGDFGADIVVGEGQSLGMPLSYGGPLLGMMAAKKSFVRSMPGRLVGHTKDRNGEDCFVVTLATREQHIRRARATSNICTNEGLCALGAGIYLSLLGRRGLEQLALLNHHASRHLAAKLQSVPGVKLPFSGTPWFNEFVVEFRDNASDVYAKMVEKGVVPGVLLSRLMPGQEDRMLVATTELNSIEHIEKYVSCLASIVA